MAALLCVGALALIGFVRRPAHAFLVPAGGAEWIRQPRPFELTARGLATEAVSYRLRFELPASQAPTGEGTTLHVQALRSFRAFLNEREIGGAGAEASSWRHARSLDLAPHLKSGSNELLIVVHNDRGSPVLLAYASGLGIATGADWLAQAPDGTWKPASRVRAERRHAISYSFPSAWQGLRASWALLLAACVAGATGSLVGSRWLAPRAQVGSWRLRPGHVRWLVMAALALLGLHNLTRLDIAQGFDAIYHIDYIRTVAATWRAPLANESWQGFQPPLFYYVAAPPYLVIARLAGSEVPAVLAMRLLMLACGLGLVEAAYRAARSAFPERPDLQNVAVATGGFLPMSVYMSHYVSNEPFAALLTAALLVAVFHLLRDETLDLARWGFRLGLLFGVALLAKVTVVLLLPALFVVLLRAARRRGAGPRAALDPLLRFALASGSVSGWYFVRNWITLGSPYVGGWDPSRGSAWNQDPGYRIPEDLLSFGGALSRPIYATFSGYWDGLYSTFWLDGFLGSCAWEMVAPAWHYDAVVACALLALPLTAAGVVGALRSLRIPRNAGQEILLFSSAAVAVYLAAIFALFMSLPVFSTVKSTYTLGLAPCYGVLIAAGFERLPRHAAVRAVVAGYLAAWLAFVFRAYFI
jgi:4-amino-4-deoxy-L-arabinose transferase-like glycosyltransferase